MNVRRGGAEWLSLAAIAGICVSGCGGKIAGEGGPGGQGSTGGGGFGSSSGGAGSSGGTSSGAASTSGGGASGSASSTSSGGSSSGSSGFSSGAGSSSSSGTGSASGSSSTSSGGSGTGSASGSSSTSSGGSSGAGSSSSGGSSGAGSGSSGGSSSGGVTCQLVPLTASSTGFVDVAELNLVGSSFVYGDGLGPGGFPPGACQTTGGHPSSECSVITFPAPGTSPQTTPSTMCLSGTVAQVIGSPPDYADIYGIAMGVSFNGVGGTLASYNATEHGIIAFQFTVSQLPTTGYVQVLLPEAATDATGDAWGSTLTGNGPVTVYLQPGLGTGQLTPSFMPPFGSPPEPSFDPTTVEGIEFHVVASATNAVPVSDFCITDLSAIVCPE